MSEENVDLIRSNYEAFSRGDIPAILAMLDPNVTWNSAENSPYADDNPYVGPEAVRTGVFARVDAEWDGFTVIPLEILDAGDTVVMHGRYRATHKVTGKRIDAQVVHVWKLRGGKITGYQQYLDTAQMRDATTKRTSA